MKSRRWRRPAGSPLAGYGNLTAQVPKAGEQPQGAKQPYLKNHRLAVCANVVDPRNATFSMAGNPFFSSDSLGEYAGRFDGATLQRGRAYAGEGRVRVKRVERAPGEIHVEAEVQGTRKHPYEVDLWLELDQVGAIVDVDNSCMCPMRENCKHVVAAMLNLGQTTDIGSIAGNGNTPSRDAAGFPEPSEAALEWLGSFDHAEAPKPPAASSQSRVVYLLRPGSPPSLSLGKSRPLKKGGAGKPAVYRPQPYDLGSARSHRDFILDEDISPLAPVPGLAGRRRLFLQRSR